MSQSLLTLNSSSLTGDHRITIYIQLLSFVLQQIFEDTSFFHTFFFLLERESMCTDSEAYRADVISWQEDSCCP